MDEHARILNLVFLLAHPIRNMGFNGAYVKERIRQLGSECHVDDLCLCYSEDAEIREMNFIIL